MIAERKQSSDIWLTIEQQQPDLLPILRSVCSCGYRYTCSSCEVVLYTQPSIHQMQYYSMDPLTLDVSPYGQYAKDDQSQRVGTFQFHGQARRFHFLENLDPQQKAAQKATKATAKRMASHTAPEFPDAPPTRRFSDRNEMAAILSQVSLFFLGLPLT